jgi:hypothetical protein|tara:strand:+ start:11793 stop:12746 length:954 start_codon:yes stop_codon:yes gene_type:complete
MSKSICTPSQFSPQTNMIYTKVKVNSVGGKSIGIVHSDTNRQLMISTPLMMNWGVNVYENSNGPSYSISLQFPREDFKTDKSDDFLNMLKSMEHQILKDAVENSKEWFGKTMSKEVIDAFWNPILKYPKNQETGDPDKDRSPTLKVKLPTWEGEYKFEVFDTNNNLLVPNEEGRTPDTIIQKASQIACILQCGGIWMANGNFGVSWKLFQGVYKENENLEVGKGVCHINLGSEEKDKPVEKLDDDEEVVSTGVVNDVTVESDEEDEEDEDGGGGGSEEQPQVEAEEVVAEVAAAEVSTEEEVKPKKKRVVKKKKGDA